MDPLHEQIIKTLRTAPPEGYQLHELWQQLGADLKLRHRVRAAVADLIDDGQLEKAVGSRVRLVGSGPAAPSKYSATGLLRMHPKGFGFVARDDGKDDVFIPERYRGAALDGDRVGITTWPSPKGTEGRVEAVLDRGRHRLTGTIARGKTSRLIPDDPRIAGVFPEIELTGDIPPRTADKQTVAARIIQYPDHAGENLLAKVELILGRPESLPTEVERILVLESIETTFPDEVQAQADAVPQAIDATHLDNRLDLRALQFITIDPETARDFDDAVCVEDSPRPGCDRLWVAVADVSHYVWPGTPLDDEARRRGCSVYLPDRAIPMLPKALSAGICSLNPDVDRFAMVARMEVDADGNVYDEFFCAAAIRSKARFDYGGVARALAAPSLDEVHEKYRPLLPYLQRLQRVSAQLRKKRMGRGSLDFDLPEPKVVLDQDDPERVRDILQSRADPTVKGAYQLVEDFMLAANEAVARYCREHGKDTMWRVHAPPAEQRLALFAEVAESFGVKVDVEEARSPKKLRDVLGKLADSSAAAPLSTLLLRSLKQAQYDIVNIGHFGLAAPDYLHFTSPIRRYPDLVVHRVMKQILAQTDGYAGGVPPPVEQGADLQRMANQSSAAERRAMEAERDVVDLYRAHFMRDKIGEEYEGTINGVTAFGMFISIDKPFVEGLVKLETLRDDRYHFEETRLRLVGQSSGRSFSLGQKVRVRIEAVSIQRRKIDLGLLDVESAPVITPKAGTEWLAQEAEYEQARNESRRQIGLAKRKPSHHGRNDDRGGRGFDKGPSGGGDRSERGGGDRSGRGGSKPPARGARPSSGAKASARSGGKPGGGGGRGGKAGPGGKKRAPAASKRGGKPGRRSR